ncbi:hypothetical protein [Clostridium sp. YIM B02551]|uniref:hypothetical protein n=1 Tax=Clostridium sp. YIM B02551 TaxID=2910679 RepID=UPI001EECA418|nr:hypothetical protein [Clostridium sp. YIM B02551]
MNKAVKYTLMVLIACIIITLSVLMPGIMLSKSEEGILNHSVVMSGENNSVKQNPSNNLEPRAESLAESLAKKVALYEKYSHEGTLVKESTEGSMGMREAIAKSTKQISAIIDKQGLPNLSGFPESYNVDAELREIKENSTVLQYWNINLSPKNNKGISLAIDANTGVLLGFKFTINESSTINIEDMAEVIANQMNMPGRLVSLNNKQYQNAVWSFDNSSLSMNLLISEQVGYTIFSMDLSTESQKVK